jgi:hypothetical protein
MNMAFWAIRRVSDGMFWDTRDPEDVGGWVPVERAWRFSQAEHDRNVVDLGQSIIEPGEEWVELGDDGQPVEAVKVAAPVRKWVVRVGDRYYGDGSTVASVDLASAARFPCPQTLMFLPGNNVPVLVHSDGTVTLDEPAPAIAQPSPYSESADVPIALVPVEDLDLVESLAETIVTLMHEATRIVVEVTELERQRDEAKARIAARLRGGK